MKIIIRPAKIADVSGIRKLVSTYAKEKRLYPRSVTEIRSFIRGFFVAENEGIIVGCVALEVYSKKIAEVRSLAVDHHWSGQDIGSRLVCACIKRARVGLLK